MLKLKWLDMHSDQQTVAWWPGHADIPGDGRADTLAKGAIYLASTLQPTSSYRIYSCLEYKALWFSKSSAEKNEEKGEIDNTPGMKVSSV